jgi:serine/threonine-protein kinase
VSSREGSGGEETIGPYRIVRRLETTETSETMLAVSHGPHGFERSVVIKRLLPHAYADPEMSRSLAREATAYARLTHPAIIRLYDFFAVNDVPAMVLEYVEGPSLQQLLEGLRAQGVRLTMAAAIHVGSRVFAALAAAHSAKNPRTREFSPVIHRDVSPGNVLITPEGEVKLANFGFAKVIGTGTHTSVNLAKGTFGYMAPEQLLCKAVTVRTDVYAAALLLRELLVGEPVFPRGNVPYVDYLQTMAKPCLTPIAELCPDLPRAIADAMARALEPDADHRSVSAGDMQRILSAHRDGGRADLMSAMASVDTIERDDVTSGERETELPSDPPTVVGTHPFARAAAPLPPDTTAQMPVVADEPFDPVINAPEDTLRRSVSTLPSMFRARSRLRRATVAALFGLGAALAVVLVVRSGGHKQARASIAVAAPPPPPPVPAAVIPPPPAEPTAPLAQEEAAAPEPVSTRGEIRVAPSHPPRRVFVDGRVIGESGIVTTITCGPHTVRVGTSGKLQNVDVPCGGTLDVAAR